MKGGEQHRKHGEREHPYSNRCPRVVPHQMSSGQGNRSAIANPSPEVPPVTRVALPSGLSIGRSLCQSTARAERCLTPLAPRPSLATPAIMRRAFKSDGFLTKKNLRPVLRIEGSRRGVLPPTRQDTSLGETPTPQRRCSGQWPSCPPRTKVPSLRGQPHRSTLPRAGSQ